MLLQAGESAYYLQVERADRNPEQLYIKITAQDKRLSFNFDPVRETLSSAWLSDVSFSDYISAGHKAQATFTQPIAIQKGISTKATEEAFVRFLLNQEPVQSFLKKSDEVEGEEVVEDECDAFVDQTVRPFTIWKAMLETEGDQLMRVEIENATFEESQTGALLIPYVAQNGRDLTSTRMQVISAST